jgi:PAS domain S-box-containing protein
MSSEPTPGIPATTAAAPPPPPAASFSRRRLLVAHPTAWVVLALSLAGSAAGWVIARNHAELTALKRFDEDANHITARLSERLLVYQDVLHGAAGLYAASVTVERAEWKSYIGKVSIEKRFPGIDGLGFIAYVRREGLDQFLATTRADKAPDFKIQNPGDGPDLFVLKYMEPQARHEAILGQDLGVEARRRAVAERARDTGETVVSANLALLGRGDGTPDGFLMMLPVYRNGQPHATLEERRANLEGWIYARFITAHLMQGILGTNFPTIHVRVLDDTPGVVERVMFDSGPLPADYSPRFFDDLLLVPGGRPWRMEFATRPGFEATVPKGTPALVAAGGVVLSLLLAGIVLSLSTTRERALAMASDMTAALRTTNERLEYERYLLQALMDGVPDHIYFKDRQSRFLRNNRTHLQIFGLTDPTQALGKTDFDFFAEEHARQAFNDEQEVIRTGLPFTKEEKETWPDGSVTWVLSTKLPLRDHNGQIVGTFGISRDITDRKRAEEAMRHAKEAAEEANRAKSQFLASMSHELRTPLNSIIGFANILLKNKAGTLSPAEINFLDRIQANGRHLLGLINQILDLSKIEAQKVEVQLAPVALDQLVRETLAQEEGLVRDKPVELLAELPPHIAPIQADADKLKQVIINLIGNALKFTERGQVTVRVLTDPADDRPLRLDVCDTGIGIPNDKLGVIFEAFQQAQAGTARKYGGTGLGLTISQALCRLMGYRIEVASEVGRGSTFSIILHAPVAAGILPAVEPGILPGGERAALAGAVRETGAEPGRQDAALYGRQDARRYTGPPAAASGRPAATPPADLAGKIVLVIDDEADSRTLLTHMIEEAGCHVISADSGEMGLHMARKLRPHLVTTDLLMPGMDGWQVVRAIKTDPDLSATPVVVISVIAGEKRGRIFGAVEILQKPVEREELLASLKRAFLPPKPRVLVVDDEADARRLVSACLEEHAAEVRMAANGREALALLDSFTPDAVVLDLLMPEMDGLAFLNALRADARYQHLPVVVVTAKDLTARESDLLRQETIEVLKKAGAFEEDLKRLLQKLLAGTGAPKRN